MDIEYKPFDLKARGAFHVLTNTLTNHERNIWARKGYPGLRKKDPEPLAKMFPAAIRRITGYVTTLDDPLGTTP